MNKEEQDKKVILEEIAKLLERGTLHQLKCIYKYVLRYLE